MKKIIVCAVFAATLVPLAAHGVDVFLETGGTAYPVQTVRFRYSTGEAMSFAKVKVFAPANPGVETVQSITDRNGYFSFTPDETGEWRVSAEDGMGHKAEIRVAAALPDPGGPDAAASAVSGAAPSGGNAGKTAAVAGGKAPLPLGIALGLSLILNVFGVWRYVVAAKGGAKGQGNKEIWREVHAH